MLCSSTDDLLQMQNDEETDDAEVSIGTEIPDHEQIGDVPSHEHIPHDDDDDHGNFASTNFCKLLTNLGHILTKMASFSQISISILLIHL